MPLRSLSLAAPVSSTARPKAAFTSATAAATSAWASNSLSGTSRSSAIQYSSTISAAVVSPITGGAAGMV